jgi:DNA-binding MarR family transcriptional regulator
VSTESLTALSPRELAAWKGMLAAHSRLLARLDSELERDHGLPLTSYEVLMYLGDADGERLRMGELADRLLLSRSGITRLVDRLERQGLIARERCERDGRGLFARLTPEGQEKLAAVRPAHLAGVRRHFISRLAPRELEQLGAIWRRLLAGDDAQPAVDAQPVVDGAPAGDGQRGTGGDLKRSSGDRRRPARAGQPSPPGDARRSAADSLPA